MNTKLIDYEYWIYKIYLYIIKQALKLQVNENNISYNKLNSILENIINKKISNDEKEIIDNGLRELLIYRMSYSFTPDKEFICNYIKHSDILYDDNYLFCIGKEENNNLYNYILEYLYDKIYSFLDKITN